MTTTDSAISTNLPSRSGLARSSTERAWMANVRPAVLFELPPPVAASERRAIRMAASRPPSAVAAVIFSQMSPGLLHVKVY